MKKLILLLAVVFCISCKKDPASDITKYYWVLESQTVTPAMTMNGKTSTDFLSLQSQGSCSENFAFSFGENGIFSVSSSGALCDMAANTSSQKWTRNGDQVTLDYGTGPKRSFTLKNDIMIAVGDFIADGGSFKMVATYRAKTR